MVEARIVVGAYLEHRAIAAFDPGTDPMKGAGTAHTDDRFTITDRLTPTDQRNGLLGVQSEVITIPGNCLLPPLICDPPTIQTAYYERDPGGELISQRSAEFGDHYYIPNEQGSTVALLDTNGTIRAGYFYDPYGAYAGAIPFNGTLPRNPWRYTGAYLDDASGLYKMGHRYYDPAGGRFTQMDPITVLGDPARASSYAYVGGDPVNLTDPTGLAPWDDFVEGIEDAFDLKLGIDVVVAIQEGDWKEVVEELGGDFLIGATAGGTCGAAAVGFGWTGPGALLTCVLVAEGFSELASRIED